MDSTFRVGGKMTECAAWHVCSCSIWQEMGATACVGVDVCMRGHAFRNGAHSDTKPKKMQFHLTSTDRLSVTARVYACNHGLRVQATPGAATQWDGITDFAKHDNTCARALRAVHACRLHPVPLPGQHRAPHHHPGGRLPGLDQAPRELRGGEGETGAYG